MLDLRFKTLQFVLSFIGCEQGQTIVEKYDKKIFISSMILKYYYHLHPLVESTRGVVD